MSTRVKAAADLDVNYELVRFVRRTRAYANEHLEEIHPELDYNTFVILLAVHDGSDGVRASDLVGNLFVHKSTISRAVSTLERLELLTRVTDPDDGRAQLLTVSTGARERVEAFRTRSYAWLGGLVADWAPDELESFARQLSRLNDAAEKKA